MTCSSYLDNDHAYSVYDHVYIHISCNIVYMYIYSIYIYTHAVCMFIYIYMHINCVYIEMQSKRGESSKRLSDAVGGTGG